MAAWPGGRWQEDPGEREMTEQSTIPPQLRRRWPTLAGIATVPVLLAIGLFDDFVEGVWVAAVLYLAWGCCGTGPGRAAGSCGRCRASCCSAPSPCGRSARRAGPPICPGCRVAGSCLLGRGDSARPGRAPLVVGVVHRAWTCSLAVVLVLDPVTDHSRPQKWPLGRLRAGQLGPPRCPPPEPRHGLALPAPGRRAETRRESEQGVRAQRVSLAALAADSPDLDLLGHALQDRHHLLYERLQLKRLQRLAMAQLVHVVKTAVRLCPGVSPPAWGSLAETTRIASCSSEGGRRDTQVSTGHEHHTQRQVRSEPDMTGESADQAAPDTTVQPNRLPTSRPSTSWSGPGSCPGM